MYPRRKKDPTKFAPEPKADWPMRINRYLAQKGHATRRDADILIEKGRVRINDRVATLGDKVLETDTVVVQVTGAKKKSYAYFAYHKPRGVITHSASQNEKEIAEVLPKELKTYNLFPVGRLDKDSHGLIILTNDGRVTDRLLSPTREHEKEYVVTTKLKLRDSFKKTMETGVDIEGYMTKPCKIKLMGENTFSIVLTEGKKHQIRRMVVALHNEVVQLKRIRILGVRLSNLKSGDYRAIEGEERETFLKALGL